MTCCGLTLTKRLWDGEKMTEESPSHLGLKLLPNSYTNMTLTLFVELIRFVMSLFSFLIVFKVCIINLAKESIEINSE